MSIGKPTIVFVHGAFHTPESLDDLAAALKSKGYHCPNTFQLRSVDAPSNNPPGLLEDAEALRTHVVECINGTGQFERYGANDCVVVMHSYGGTVGSQALEGLGQKDRAGKKAIKRLVFIAANVPRVGDNLLDQYNSFGEAKGYGDSADNIKVDVRLPSIAKHCVFHLKSARGALDSHEQNQNFLFVAPPEAFYNDIPPERRKELYKKLVPTGMGYVSDVEQH